MLAAFSVMIGRFFVLKFELKRKYYYLRSV
nr:MAG TPA: hypothetical protein [Bacteriophage sp.]